MEQGGEEPTYQQTWAESSQTSNYRLHQVKGSKRGPNAMVGGQKSKKWIKYPGKLGNIQQAKQ